jgi:hypothetical protein
MPTAGRHWLAPAVEMAARVSEDWPAFRDHAGIRWTCFPGRGTLRPGVQASRVQAARDFTVGTLQRWGVSGRCEDIALVVSELLANALLHARPAPREIGGRWPIQLGLLRPGHCVMCAVADPSTAVPVPRKPDSFGETGRGLHVIAALSDHWGYLISADKGKVVWALFSS